MTTGSRARISGSVGLLLLSMLATSSLDAQHTAQLTSTVRPEMGSMWTFEKPPLEYWQNRYGFRPDPSWLDHVRLSVLRWPGCSSSFVSANGLILTNHHCARSCASTVAPADTDYMKTGFAASSLAEERKCPGLFLDQLIGIEDVTARIAAARAEGRTAGAEMASLRERCTRDGSVCQIVGLYQGGRYALHRYHRFDDVRLVFVPEEQVAFYGGDADNFTYPRYAIDVALLRAYDHDQPYRPEHFLKWSATGATEGEAVFAIGTPGPTGRLNSVAQMEYFRDVVYPTALLQYERQISVLELLSARGAAERRKYSNMLFGSQNGFKSATRYLAGLQNERYMATKRAFEQDVQAALRSRPELAAKYDSARRSIAAAADSARAITLKHRYYGFTATDHAWTASQLVRIAVQSQLPDSLRLSPYREASVGEIKRLIEQPRDTAYERLNTIAWFAEMQRELPARDSLLLAILAGRTAEQAATEMLAQSRLDDASFRTALLDGGLRAVQQSTDPFVVIARASNERFTPLAEKLQRYTEAIAANAEKVTQTIYALYGDAIPPDGTSTLRISDGVVAGYPYNGTVAPHKTTFYGLFARSADFDNQGDFALPQRWLDARSRLDMSTPLNFVTTNDIIGGNSGSPVINTRGEVVGVIFDNNIEGASNRFFFAADVMRAVAVHARAIPETIRNVFHAPRLAEELDGK